MISFCPRVFFFFNDTATTEIYTLSLHDALPISRRAVGRGEGQARRQRAEPVGRPAAADRKSTRLNSSHSQISYAVFCLKKKKNDLICRQRTLAPRRLHLRSRPTTPLSAPLSRST